MNIQIICILSFLFHGNVDVIELIYKKKKIIEYNETILHYLLNGLHSGKLYSYNISALEEKESMINFTCIPQEEYMNESLSFGVLSINQHNLHKKYLNESFLKNFLLDKIHYRWKEASDEYLEQDKRWCQRVILESLSFPNFITLRNDGGETILPSLKQKTNAINNVLSNYGILYLNSIYEDFKNNESTYCIVLNGDIGMQFII